MFGDKSFEELHTQIQENNDTSEISDASFVYLNQYLDELKKSDDVLESYESEIISQQLEYHNRLNDLYQEYEEKVGLLHQKNKNELLALFVQLENTEIPETKLHKIEGILENKIFEQSKNNLHDTLNIQGGIRGLLDCVIILNEDNNLFLNDLTLYFLDNNISISIDEEGNLEISNDELNSLLDTFTKANIENPILPDSIELNTSNGLFTYNFENKKIYFKELYSDKKLEQSLLDSLSGEIPNQQIRLIDEKYGINIQGLSFIEKLNTYIDEGIYTHEDIIIFHENKNISTELLLKLLEQDENFNYLFFLEKYPLPENVINMTTDFIDKHLNINKNQMNKEDIIKRTHLLVLLFLSTESDGRNVEHDTLQSSASGYFQFLRQGGPGGSIETAVNRLKNVLDPKTFNDKFKGNILDDSRLYSAEDQNLLALGNIFGRGWIEEGEFNVNSKIKKHLENFYLHKNIWSLKILYKQYHHTNADGATINRLVSKEKEYSYEKGSQLISNIYDGNNTLLVKNHY